MKLWVLGGSFLALLVVVILLWTTLSTWMGADASVSADRIRTAQVQRGDLLRDVNVQGRIVAAVSPTLYSPANGTVTLQVQPGNPVETGQVLAVLDSPEVQSEFEQQSSALAGIQAELDRQKIQARTESASPMSCG